MKKVVLLFSAAFLIAGLTFAQTPQTQEKAVKQAEKKEVSKDNKAGCDTKTKAACGDVKRSSGCCSSAKKASAPATTPEKK